MVLLAWNEIIVPVKVNDLPLEAQQILVRAQSIDESASCGNVLKKIKGHQLLVSVLNISESPISIKIFEL